MPLKGIPGSINAEILYALARMGHGDYLVIADANFPSDSVAANCVIATPLRSRGATADIARDILQLMPLDQYQETPVRVMERVSSDVAKNLQVPAYDAIAIACGLENKALLGYVERFEFYELAKRAFFVIQSDDAALYANVILSKGVIS